MKSSRGLRNRNIVLGVLAICTLFLVSTLSNAADTNIEWIAINTGLSEESLEVNNIALSPAYTTDNAIVAATTGGIYMYKGTSWANIDAASTATANSVALCTLFTATGPKSFSFKAFAATDKGIRLGKNSTWTYNETDTPFRSIAASQIEYPSPDVPAFTVLAAAADGRLKKSTDTGNTWAFDNALSGILSVTVSPSFITDRTAYAGTTGAVWSTYNGGGSWQSNSSGLLPTAKVNTLAVAPYASPDTSGTVFAGTDQGIYSSTDGGQGWKSCG